MIERIKLLMSVRNLSPAQLALEIGVQRSGISHLLSGRNKASLDFVMKILESYPEINESWLLMGKGTMLKTKSEMPTFIQEDNRLEEDKIRENEPVKEKEVNMDNSSARKEVMEVQEKKTETKSQAIPKSISQQATEKPNKNSINEDLLAITSLSSKKIVQLIAIFEDNSFKVFHSKE